jgi:hypothetical protein
MSDISDISDKESFGEKDEEFNVKDYQDDIESDESFNELINDANDAKKNVNTILYRCTLFFTLRMNVTNLF